MVHLSVALTISYCTHQLNTFTMFAAAAAALRRTLRARFTRNASAAAPVVAAPTVLRPDRRTRTPEHEISSNRVRFGFIEAKSFDKRERSIAVAEPSLIDVRPIINRRILKELEDSLDGAYWSRPVGGRSRRAPIRLGSA